MQTGTGTLHTWPRLEPEPRLLADRAGTLGSFASALLAPQPAEEYVPTASKAGSCPRRLGYWRLRIPQTDPHPPRIRVLRRIGEAIEETVLRRLIDAGRAHSPGLRVRIPYPYGWIHGRIDALLDDDAVLDVKSVTASLYETAALSQAPMPDAILQVNLYLHGLRLAGHHSRRYGAILYIDRSAGSISDFWFEYSPALAERSVRMLTDVEDLARRGMLPDRPEGLRPNAPPCSFCPWRTLCAGS